MIHTIINIKQDLMEIQEIKKTFGLESDMSLNLVGLVLEGNKAYLEEMTATKYYCSQCSSERGKEVYHNTSSSFQVFRKKWERYASELQKLHNLIY